jgi:CheY-like chemotaxis protein
MFQKPKTAVPILIAEDDEEDRMLVEEAMEESLLVNPLYFVQNGEEVMDFLYNIGKYADKNKYPLPGLILLDLNMPKKDGRQVLGEIRQDPNLKKIPIIILTTSKAEEDILRSYDLGVNSYITKPVTFDGLVEIVKNLGKYWFEIVTIPYHDSNNL